MPPTDLLDKASPVDEQLWTINQLSEFLQVPVKTIRGWREKREGPRGLRIGKHLRFRRMDVLEWLENQ
jgi:excisionase family DNA binding protein